MGYNISVREACHKEVLIVWQKWCFVEVHNKVFVGVCDITKGSVDCLRWCLLGCVTLQKEVLVKVSQNSHYLLALTKGCWLVLLVVKFRSKVV